MGLARLHERWRAEYPRTEEHPVLQPSFSLGSDGALNTEFTAGPPSLRLWMLSVTGERLVQLQHDRLILNWRRIDGSSLYPGFSSLLPEFTRLWADFGACENESGLSSPDPRVVEVTYINRVALAEGQSAGAAFTALSNGEPGPVQPLTVVNAVTEDRVDHPWGLGQASTSLQRMPGPVGQTYALSIATRLSITSRPSVGAVRDLFYEAHRRSVGLFLRSTTRTAQTTWGGPR